jgi:hypothetical protein
VREIFRDVFLVLGVIFAGIQVIQGVKHPEKIGTAAPWIVVGALFVLSAFLSLFGIYQKRKAPETKTENSVEAFKYPRWELVTNQKFMNEAIDVDGKSFRNCSFDNVRFLFHGKAPTEFIRPIFGGSLVMDTDHPPTMFWIHLHNIFASIPGATVESSAVDEKGQKVKSDVKVRPALSKQVATTSPREILRLKVRQLSQDLFDFLHEVGPTPEVKPRNSNEPIEDYLRHAYQVTGPRIKALHHGYEARGLGDRVNKMYHELEAAGVQHELKLNDLVSQVQNEHNIRTIAEALFRTAANMEMQDVAKGSGT